MSGEKGENGSCCGRKNGGKGCDANATGDLHRGERGLNACCRVCGWRGEGLAENAAGAEILWRGGEGLADETSSNAADLWHSRKGVEALAIAAALCDADLCCKGEELFDLS